MDLTQIIADLDADEKALRDHLAQLQAGIQETIGKLNQIAGARAIVEKIQTQATDAAKHSDLAGEE